VVLKSPVGSAVGFFPNAILMGPFAFVTGMSIAAIHKYKPQNVIGWILVTVGVGLLILLKVDSHKGMWVGFQVIEALGLGPLATSPRFAILAPLPVQYGSQALSFFIFVRFSAQVWGLTIGSSILQNELKKKLPSDVLAQFSGKGAELAYNIIPTISGMKEPIQTEVRKAFADSLRKLWIAMVAFAGAGLVLSLFLKEVPMHRVTDKN